MSFNASFQKAQRHKAKLRCALAGPSGSGKTYSALLMAFGLGGKVALIDTENGSGELYANLGEYDVCRVQAPFTPDKYIEAIRTAEREGYDVLIIDSLSHAWAGEGGLLDMQGKIADSGKGNSYTAWRTVTPKHNALVEAMLQSRCHVIATVRSKQDYIQQKDEKTGKTEIKKVGLAPVQREGLEYEFTVFFDLSAEHVASASKDRTSLFDGRFIKPSKDLGKELLDWLNTGTAVQNEPEQKKPEPAKEEPKGAPPEKEEEPFPDPISDAQVKKIHTLFTKLGISDKGERKKWIMSVLSLQKLESTKDISKDQASRIINNLELAAKQKESA